MNNFTCCVVCSPNLKTGGVFNVKLKPPAFGGSIDAGALMLVLLAPNWKIPGAGDGVACTCV